MKRIFIATIAVSITLILSGCDEKNPREWYIEHHNEMIDKYTECLLDGTWDIKVCQNARDAIKHERNSPDVQKGLKEAYAKLDAKLSTQSIPDLNNVR
ncbi:EexN family lipoprotein [Raoultella terrigena]|uniref:EexN family lipoprotein n=1 Tax=Raoultella terrigena TaxID=577 RepID=UPI000696031F|nr:EexN family lipoprotein [Raoultella terrigena]